MRTSSSISFERWTPTVERIGATFFEATTAMAFDLFAREGVDAAVIETGLGGRLDSTNVIRPLAGRCHVDRHRSRRVPWRNARGDRGREGGHLQARRARGHRRARRRIRALLADLASDARSDADSRCRDVMHAPDDVTSAATERPSRSRSAASADAVRTGLAGAHQASNASLALLDAERRGRPAGDQRSTRRARRCPRSDCQVGSSGWVRTSSTSRTIRTARRCSPPRSPRFSRRRLVPSCSACSRQGLARRDDRSAQRGRRVRARRTRRPRPRAARGSREAAALRARARVERGFRARFRSRARRARPRWRHRRSSPGPSTPLATPWRA